MNTVELMDGLTLLSIGENMPPAVGIILLSVLGVILAATISLAFTALSDGFYGPLYRYGDIGFACRFYGILCD